VQSAAAAAARVGATGDLRGTCPRRGILGIFVGDRVTDHDEKNYGMSRQDSKEGVHALNKYSPCATSLNRA